MQPGQLSLCSVSYRLENWRITSLFLAGTSLLFFKLTRPATGSNQLPIQWVLWSLLTRHQADHSLSYAHIKFRDKLTFTSIMCQCFQCSLQYISVHCYKTHAHTKGHLTLQCKCCGAVQSPPSLSKNDGTVVQPYITKLYFGIILLTTKIVIFVIYSSQRLHIYIYIYICVCVKFTVSASHILHLTITMTEDKCYSNFFLYQE